MANTNYNWGYMSGGLTQNNNTPYTYHSSADNAPSTQASPNIWGNTNNSLSVPNNVVGNSYLPSDNNIDFSNIPVNNTPSLNNTVVPTQLTSNPASVVTPVNSQNPIDFRNFALNSGAQTYTPSASNAFGTNLWGSSQAEVDAFNADRLSRYEGLTGEQILAADAATSQQQLQQDQNLWSGVGTLANTAFGAFNAYNAFQGVQQAQEALDFRKDSWAQDFAQRKENYEYNKARQESKDEALSR